MPDATPNLDPAILDHNLAALARTDSAVASTLDAVRSHMPDAIPDVTRDGRISLRLPGSDGRTAWFGNTSIPHTRATALVSQFQAGNANVLLPGISEGSEVTLLLKQFSSHRAVFVWEPDPVNLLLALRLHDFAQAIADDRLVFIVANEQHLTEALLSALEHRPGHYCPDRIMMWPWYAFASIADCRTAVEVAYREIEHRRQARLAEAQRHIASLPDPLPTTPITAALLAVHANEETWALADGLASAAEQAGWQLASSLVRKPADVHPLARVSKLANELHNKPHAALLLDICRADIADVLPPTVPAITWLTHNTRIPKDVTSKLGPSDQVIAVDSSLANHLSASGLDAQRLSVQPLPCLRFDEDPPPEWDDRPVDVAIVANLAPTDPAAYGHELSTHTKVWQAAVEAIRNRVNYFTDSDIDAVLDTAESKLRIRIDHADAREHIRQALSGPVATSIIWHDLSQLITKHGLRATYWGLGWQPNPYRTIAGPVPGLAGRNAIYHQAKCVIFASPTGIVPTDVLLAAQAGAAVIWRRHKFDSRPGGLETILKPDEEAVAFATNERLPSALQKLLASPDSWRAITSQARHRCRTDHMPDHTLRAIQTVATSFFTVRTD